MQLAPAAQRVLAQRFQLGARVDGRPRRRAELAAADADAAEEEAVARERGVQPARALGQRREPAVARGEAAPGADGGDVVQVAPHPLELEQDRPGARELRRRDEPERLLAGVRVGDGVRRPRTRRTRAPRRRDRPRASRPRRPARGRGACRRAARRRAGCGRRRRGSGSGPDSITPAWIGPTATSYGSWPRTRTVQRSSGASWSTSGRSGSCPSKPMP